jgi:hypothetical protein
MRLPDGFHGVMAAGAFGRTENGEWEACTPNGRRGLLSAHHTVTEHADGTITVTPSIQVDPLLRADGQAWRAGWHGWLERGIWRSV